MIYSFANKETAALWNGLRVRRFDGAWVVLARAKLAQIEAASDLEFLRVPPGNRLEKLSGDRNCQYSIRINSQWRVCFEWRDGGAWDVEIIDYH